ncbi:MAG: efflux RND transporter periplasmic adaptor subunit [Gammaproteobacteria bacterium]
MLRTTILVLATTAALAACSKDAKDPAKPGAQAADTKGAQEGKDKGANKGREKAAELLIAPEDVMTVQTNALASGPVVTGSVQPERKADLRAEVSAVVLQVLKETGDVVKRGDVLVKLDETAIRDQLMSAEEAARASKQALDQSERQVERMKTLRASGMTSAQAMDDAEVRRNNAASDLAAARTRAAQARQQLARTVVRAPFDGVVSDRKVSAGDTASIGKELLKVIDPTSMRFEGRVSADRVSSVKVGQPVSFRINGYSDQEFRGVVKRVDPAANEITRQVEVLVSFAPNSPQPRVSGLYGEGRIETDTSAEVMLPAGALVRAGDKAYTWRLKDKSLQKVDLALGVRDERTGSYQIKNGITVGDVILRHPSSALQDGQKVQMAPARVASAEAARVNGNVASTQGK